MVCTTSCRGAETVGQCHAEVPLIMEQLSRSQINQAMLDESNVLYGIN
jgi:hypothetical protein